MKYVLTALLLLVSTGAAAALDVVATTTNMGMLVQTVGADRVRLRVLAPPDRDPHQLQVRPNMMAALRRADLVVAVGAELEEGWLPAALQGAHNPAVLPGELGYFEAARHVELLDAHGVADRSQGDVHPGGNPHFYMDPVRMAAVAEALAERLAQLDPARAEQYRANARTFRQQVEARLPRWRRRSAEAPGVVMYHKDADYLMRLLNVEVLGYLEPIPGVPPSPNHLRRLVGQLRGHEGVVLHAQHQSERGAQFLARQLDWAAHALPTQVPRDADANDYFALISSWVSVLETGGR